MSVVAIRVLVSRHPRDESNESLQMMNITAQLMVVLFGELFRAGCKNNARVKQKEGDAGCSFFDQNVMIYSVACCDFVASEKKA